MKWFIVVLALSLMIPTLVPIIPVPRLPLEAASIFPMFTPTRRSSPPNIPPIIPIPLLLLVLLSNMIRPRAVLLLPQRASRLLAHPILPLRFTARIRVLKFGIRLGV